MTRLLPLALLLLAGCGTLSDLEGMATRAAGDAIGRAIGSATSRAASGGGGPALLAYEIGTDSRIPDRMVPVARVDTSEVEAWAARELGVEVRRTGTSPAGPDGGVLLRFEQTRDGVPVVGGFLVAEALPGEATVATFAGTLFDLDDVPRRPRQDAAAAVRTAGGTGDADLVILARTHPFAQDHTLAWRVRTGRGLDARDVFVDAQSGRRLGALPLVILHQAARRDTVPAVVALPTVYQGERTAMGLDLRLVGHEHRYRLSNPEWGTKVGAIFDGAGRAVASPEADRWPDLGPWKNGAYDAFWGFHATHSHLADLGWRGLKGSGRTYYQVFFGNLDGSDTPFEGAGFDESRNLFLIGQKSEGLPYAEITVVGHEVSHAIDHHSAKLAYFGESGAVDEGIADIRGIAAHRTALGGVNGWRVGTEVGVSRSLRDPNNGPTQRPDTYEGDFWIDPAACAALPEDDQEDQCGVHVNSGVAGRWFYLLSVGGDGENDHGDVYEVEGVGFDLAERIVHRAHTRYLGPSSDYDAFRVATLRAASDLTGEHVGVCDTPTLDAVQNAWYAVGVGPQPCVCLEGSMTLSTATGDGSASMKLYVRDNAIAAEVASSEGTIYSRSRMGGATITMRGAVEYRGVPTDELYDAAGLPRRRFRVDLPREPLPQYDALEEAWDAARTGRRRTVGDFTAYEYDWGRVARGVQRAGVPLSNVPSGSIWTVRNVCLSFMDVTAGMTQTEYGPYEQRMSWLGFMGLPVEFSSSEGTMRITNLREHSVPDEIIGR